MTTDLIAQAEAAVQLIQHNIKFVELDELDRETYAELLQLLPALIARIRELEGERDNARRDAGAFVQSGLDWKARAEAAEATVASLKEQVEVMQNLLCLADETIMELNGCFPLGHGQREYKLRQACLAIRAVTGDDHDERKRRAAIATENQTNG